MPDDTGPLEPDFVGHPVILEQVRLGFLDRRQLLLHPDLLLYDLVLLALLLALLQLHVPLLVLESQVLLLVSYHVLTVTLLPKFLHSVVVFLEFGFNGLA